MDRGSLSEPENRLGVLNEPPCAEPHAGWCGGWRLDTSGYPIICVLIDLHIVRVLTFCIREVYNKPVGN